MAGVKNLNEYVVLIAQRYKSKPSDKKPRKVPAPKITEVLYYILVKEFKISKKNAIQLFESINTVSKAMRSYPKLITADYESFFVDPHLFEDVEYLICDQRLDFESTDVDAESNYLEALKNVNRTGFDWEHSKLISAIKQLKRFEKGHANLSGSREFDYHKFIFKYSITPAELMFCLPYVENEKNYRTITSSPTSHGRTDRFVDAGLRLYPDKAAQEFLDMYEPKSKFNFKL